MNEDDFRLDHIREDRSPTGKSLLRLVSDEDAKLQLERRLAEAIKALPERKRALLKEPYEEKPIPAANDNDLGFKSKEPWPLMEAFSRNTFRTDPQTNEAMRGTALYIDKLVSAANADAVGQAIHRPGKQPTSDFDVQRTKQGKIDWDGERLVLERNPKTGRVKKAEICSPGPLGKGFEPTRDDLFSQTQTDARMKLDDLLAIIGPLWPYLHDAICNRARFTDIAAGLGFKQPVVGSVLVKLALVAALEPVRALRADADFRQFVEKNGLPVASGRFARVAKLAA